MKTCTICDKGSAIAGKRAFLRSHYNPAATIRKYPNLQWVRDLSGTRTKACAKCIKRMHQK